jgi:hypothetical protein
VSFSKTARKPPKQVLGVGDGERLPIQRRKYFLIVIPQRPANVVAGFDQPVNLSIGPFSIHPPSNVDDVIIAHSRSSAVRSERSVRERRGLTVLGLGETANLARARSKAPSEACSVLMCGEASLPLHPLITTVVGATPLSKLQRIPLNPDPYALTQAANFPGDV